MVPQHDKYNLFAFLATLGAIVGVAMMAKWGEVGVETVRILDTIAIGLIGVIGTFKPRASSEPRQSLAVEAPATVTETTTTEVK